MKLRMLARIFALALTAGLTARAQTDSLPGSWMLGPFVKQDSVNPILRPLGDTHFFCPIRKTEVHWEQKDVFNPAAVVRKDTVYLLYRAQDSIGHPSGTSRIGLAWSTDGRTFVRNGTPVLYPDDDFMKGYEWEGGCEDPRVVENESGLYVMTYTAFDGKTARLSVATSKDLVHWRKEGLAFGRIDNGRYQDLWSKSGSIVCRRDSNKMFAEKINGRFWMFWGESNVFLASSVDLINWEPILQANGDLLVVFGPRERYFDSDLVEPGPPAVLTKNGILLIYNSRNSGERGDPQLPPGTYAAGQVLLDRGNPSQVLRRSDTCFFYPQRDYEITGQVNNVCFLEGLIHYKKEWLLYYGTADSKIAVAAAKE